MAKEKKGAIQLHNTPAFYLEYMKNWLTHKRNEKSNPVEIAIIEDLTTLVQIAVDGLNPVSAEPTKPKSN